MLDNLEWVDEAWLNIKEKIDRTSKKIGANFPHSSVDGTYLLEEPHWWTAGFWPGILWHVYLDSRDELLRQIAEQCEEKLDQVITDYYRLDHDMGFMWTLTSVARYKVTGEENSKRRALLTANLLMGRFNVNGNFIRAWNPWYEGDENSGLAIIDCAMNLPLLFWASETTGDPRFKSVAKKHADTIITHFIRQDGSVQHIVRFDPESGEQVEFIGGQGFGPDSAWARGASWAIYGLTLCYQHTQEDKYLQAAKKVAHFFISNLPEDFVPVWDFRLPADIPANRDSSAAAIAASGLLLLADNVGSIESPLYRESGKRILRSLYKNYGSWNDLEEDGLILHGTSHFPEGKNIDNPLIYGDYFFVEGIARLKGYEQLFW